MIIVHNIIFWFKTQRDVSLHVTNNTKILPAIWHTCDSPERGKGHWGESFDQDVRSQQYFRILWTDEWGFRCIETTRRDYKYKFVYTYTAYIYITIFIIMNCVNCVVETLNKKWRGQGSVDRSRPELLNVISKLDWRNSAMLFIITLMVIYHQRSYIYPSTALVSYEFWNWLNHSCHPCFTYTRSKLCRLCSYFILSQTKEWHDSRTTRFVLPAVRPGV